MSTVIKVSDAVETLSEAKTIIDEQQRVIQTLARQVRLRNSVGQLAITVLLEAKQEIESLRRASGEAVGGPSEVVKSIEDTIKVINEVRSIQG